MITILGYGFLVVALGALVILMLEGFLGRSQERPASAGLLWSVFGSGLVAGMLILFLFGR
ncbi:MAG: hypothetical protein M3Z04_24525 [Chloroflexota bacterium]|nr:hypothetical protein [Chloroflexota bacterium]